MSGPHGAERGKMRREARARIIIISPHSWHRQTHAAARADLPDLRNKDDRRRHDVIESRRQEARRELVRMMNWRRDARCDPRLPVFLRQQAE